MGVMDRFERRLSRLVNGVSARTFKSPVEPVEVAAALQRECDDRAAIVSRGRTMVPNAFTVELGASDHERLSGYFEPLVGRALRDGARARRRAGLRLRRSGRRSASSSSTTSTPGCSASAARPRPVSATVPPR